MEQENLKTVSAAEKNRSLHALSRDSSVYTVSLWQQTMSCTKRYCVSLLILTFY